MLSDGCPVCVSVTFVHCGQTVGRIKMKLDVQVGLDPGHICVRWGLSSPSPKGHSPRPISGPYLLRPNDWMDQDATWYGARPQPRRLCIRWRLRSTFPKKVQSPLPNFWPISIVAKRLHASRCHWYGVGLNPGDFVLDGDPTPVIFRPMFIIVIVISLQNA